MVKTKKEVTEEKKVVKKSGSKTVKKPAKSPTKRPRGRPPLKPEDRKVKESFKSKYDNDPNFKQKHLDYLTTKVKCECGVLTTRNNLKKHKLSHLHKNKLDKNSDESTEEIAEEPTELSVLIEKVDELNKLMEKLILI